jgi:hypothetical protein
MVVGLQTVDGAYACDAVFAEIRYRVISVVSQVAITYASKDAIVGEKDVKRAG